MADQFEWPQYEEFLILDGGLDHRVQVDECPRCASVVRTESRSKHETVCWGPAPSTPDNPFKVVDRDLASEYVGFLHRLLEKAPELGEHVVKNRTACSDGQTIFRTVFYGKDMLITVERAVRGG